MKKLFLLLPLLAVYLTSCDDSVDLTSHTYRQDLCMFTWHGIGKYPTFVTDAKKKYEVINQWTMALKTDSAYRMMATYEPLADDASKCSLARLAWVPVLSDSSKINIAECDSVAGVKAVWQGGGYINMTLEFMYDGYHDGRESPILQTFGYRVDKMVERTADKPAECVVSVFFRQAKVPQLEYRTSLTMSISPDSLKLKKGDKLTIHAAWKDKVNGLEDKGSKDFKFEI